MNDLIHQRITLGEVRKQRLLTEFDIRAVEALHVPFNVGERSAHDRHKEIREKTRKQTLN